MPSKIFLLNCVSFHIACLGAFNPAITCYGLKTRPPIPGPLSMQVEWDGAEHHTAINDMFKLVGMTNLFSSTDEVMNLETLYSFGAYICSVGRIL